LPTYDKGITNEKKNVKNDATDGEVQVNDSDESNETMTANAVAQLK